MYMFLTMKAWYKGQYNTLKFRFTSTDIIRRLSYHKINKKKKRSANWYDFCYSTMLYMTNVDVAFVNTPIMSTRKSGSIHITQLYFHGNNQLQIKSPCPSNVKSIWD